MARQIEDIMGDELGDMSQDDLIDFINSIRKSRTVVKEASPNTRKRKGTSGKKKLSAMDEINKLAEQLGL